MVCLGFVQRSSEHKDIHQSPGVLGFLVVYLGFVLLLVFGNNP
jgi:hypothetical protein